MPQGLEKDFYFNAATWGKNMVEITNHIAYELLNTKFKRVFLDYVILSIDCDYKGMVTHKDAVIAAFRILHDRHDYSISIEPDKMAAVKDDIDEFLKPPADEYYDSKPKGNRGFNIPDPLTYWFAFLEPPQGNSYLKSDFIQFNDLLFPNKSDVEVYRWNDGFSDYFDEAKEFWGTGLWSAYDRKTGIMVVIGASPTD